MHLSIGAFVGSEENQIDALYSFADDPSTPRWLSEAALQEIKRRNEHALQKTADRGD